MKARGSHRSKEPSTLVGWPVTIVRALDAHGVDGRQLAREAGIDPGCFEDPEARVPGAAVARLFELAAEATANPAFGLVAARFAQQTTFSALGYAMMASDTIKEALERVVRYRKIIGDRLEVRVEALPDRYRVVISFAGGARLPYVALEAGAAIIVRAMRLLRGTREFNPIAVQLERPTPADLEPYRRYFRAPIVFGCRLTAVEFARATIDAPLASGHAKLAQQSDAMMIRHLAGVDGGDISHRVEGVLLDILASGAPTKEAVARRLGMSPRNLQRHLSAEGYSFKELLRGSRLRLADGHLSEGRLSVKEIAFLLGFADGGAFSRAYKRWTGRAPTRGAAASATSLGSSPEPPRPDAGGLATRPAGAPKAGRHTRRSSTPNEPIQ